MLRYVIAAALVVAPLPLAAQNVSPTVGYEQIRQMEVPVIAGDITDRPYVVLETVIKGVRKATVFSRSASEEKVFRELWEDAEKLGADAVVNATFGESRITAFSWGTREARGQAIRFLTDDEIAARSANGAAVQQAAEAAAAEVAPPQ